MSSRVVLSASAAKFPSVQKMSCTQSFDEVRTADSYSLSILSRTFSVRLISVNRLGKGTQFVATSKPRTLASAAKTPVSVII